jgi:hypothetical protein
MEISSVVVVARAKKQEKKKKKRRKKTTTGSEKEEDGKDRLLSCQRFPRFSLIDFVFQSSAFFFASDAKTLNSMRHKRSSKHTKDKTPKHGLTRERERERKKERREK